MPTIGVIGANGQVGTEVCLYLSLLPGCHVVPIVRNPIGSAFLRRLGLACRSGDVGVLEEGKRLLDGCDVVVDMSLPRGTASGIKSQIRRTVVGAIAGSQPGSRFVYTSTVMAFGMLGESHFTNRILARTIYGATKRYGERLARNVGRAGGHDAFVLRLGQVHGELQEVSRAILTGLGNRKVAVPTGPSWTVFAFSVAEALANIGRGLEEPGQYTLVSVPEWSWTEVCKYYCHRSNLDPELIEIASPSKRPWWLTGTAARLRGLLGGSVMQWAVAHRELLAGHLLDRFPSAERRAIAWYGTRRAARNIKSLQDAAWYRPFDSVFLGAAPGRRLRSLTDSRVTMGQYADGLRALFQRFLSDLRAP